MSHWGIFVYGWIGSCLYNHLSLLPFWRMPSSWHQQLLCSFQLSSLPTLQMHEPDFHKHAYWTGAKKLIRNWAAYRGDELVGKIGSYRARNSYRWQMDFYGEHILSSEGHRRLNTAPSLCMQHRTLKYACKTADLWQWLQMSKKNLYVNMNSGAICQVWELVGYLLGRTAWSALTRGVLMHRAASGIEPRQVSVITPPFHCFTDDLTDP